MTNMLLMFGIGDGKILKKNCFTDGAVTSVERCWWAPRKKQKLARLYASEDNTAYSHIIVFRYSVNGKVYIGKRYIDMRYYAPSKGTTILVYYDPADPKKYACYGFGPGEF